MQPLALHWQTIGLVLALVLIFATGVAVWTRWAANAKLRGQTIWHVVVGVGGVIVIAGIRIGWDEVGFLGACFSVAAIPMAIEYFNRLHVEALATEKVLQESTDEHPSVSR